MALKVAVLMGGTSSERDISLMSGAAVANALKQAGYEVAMLDVRDKSIVSLPSSSSLALPDSPSANPITTSLVPTTLSNLKEDLREQKTDVVFIALHGRLGEDGAIQGLLEVLGVLYTGSGVLASAIAMDKVMAKKIFISEGIPTSNFTAIHKDDVVNQGFGVILKDIKGRLKFPVVVKPAREGSSIGVSIVLKEDELEETLVLAFKYDEKVLIEEHIEGTEVTVGILGNKDLTVLPPIEIVSKSGSGFYDYRSKYTKDLSDHIIPPRIPEEACQLVCETAIRAYKALGCRGVARVDTILGNDNIAYVLEVNTIPGFTQTSLVPDAARAMGIEFPELVDRIVKLALENMG